MKKTTTEIKLKVAGVVGSNVDFQVFYCSDREECQLP